MELIHSKERLVKPSSFEEAHAWKEVIELSISLATNALITSYDDEDVTSFNAHGSPSMNEENVKIVVLDSKA